MSRLRVGAAALAAVAVLLAGCASSHKNTVIVGAAETTVGASGTTESAVHDSAVTTVNESTPTSRDALTGLSAKCKEKFAGYLAKVGQLGSQPNAYKDLVPLLKDLLSGAPADVQAAAKPMLDAFGKMAAVIDKYNGDIAKATQDPDFAAIGEAMSSADSRAASKKIDDWLKSTCGG